MLETIDKSEEDVMERLRDVAENHPILNGTDAWSCFSSPATKKKFNKKGVELSFTKDEVSAIKRVKSRLVTQLEKKSGKRCVYCKKALGNYGWSWDIEHIYCKSKNPKDTFSLDNITTACKDCNYNKNNHVDKKPPYDIINPNLPNFVYGEHLNYFQVSTENICIVKYRKISAEGINTYNKLKLFNSEFLETWAGLSKNMKIFLTGLDSQIERFKVINDDHDVANFLLEIKNRIASKQIAT